MAFTPQKDVNFKILENLNDRDLLNYCQTNKDAQKLCNDENFWRRRTLQKFQNIKIPYGMSWRQYYLFRLSHEIIVLEYPGIKTEVVIDKNSPYMLGLLRRLKEHVQRYYSTFKLKDDDKILSLIAKKVANKFIPGNDEDDESMNANESLNDIYIEELAGIRMDDDTVFDLTQEDIDNYYQGQRFPELPGLPLPTMQMLPGVLPQSPDRSPPGSPRRLPMPITRYLRSPPESPRVLPQLPALLPQLPQPPQLPGLPQPYPRSPESPSRSPESPRRYGSPPQKPSDYRRK